MNIKEFIKSTFPKRNSPKCFGLKHLEKEIGLINKDIRELIKEHEVRLKELHNIKHDMLNNCIHPQKYISIRNEGRYVFDGYGSDEYTGDILVVRCRLCSKNNISELHLEYCNIPAGGSPKLLEKYLTEFKSKNR